MSRNELTKDRARLQRELRTRRKYLDKSSDVYTQWHDRADLVDTVKVNGSIKGRRIA